MVLLFMVVMAVKPVTVKHKITYAAYVVSICSRGLFNPLPRQQSLLYTQPTPYATCALMTQLRESCTGGIFLLLCTEVITPSTDCILKHTKSCHQALGFYFVETDWGLFGGSECIISALVR